MPRISVHEAVSRRAFLRGTAALSILVAAGCTGLSTPTASARRVRPLLKPKRLARGSTVGIIAPASGVKPDTFDKALAAIEGLGFRTKVGRYARGNGELYSGTETERLADLQWAFGDPEIDGIWCVRGGIGVQRLLPGVDFPLIQRNPKVLIGFSDITALHVAIHERCGLVTFHGPVGISTFSDYTRQHVLDAVMGAAVPRRIEVSPFNRQQTDPGFKTEVITPGCARGRLAGGNLTVLTGLIGTPWGLSDVNGALLFLEEVEETPQKIERMLTQLRQALDFSQLAGVALGVFSKCVPKPTSPSPPTIEILKSHFAPLGVPVVCGLSFGHIRDHCTIPFGLLAELDADAATLTFLESAVS
jgi:muramoyltetrapeptide carboxypeptidase